MMSSMSETNDNRRAKTGTLVILFGIALAFFVASFYVLSRG